MRPGLTKAKLAVLATALRLSRSTLFALAAAGMPTDDPDRARAWLGERRRRSPGAGLPRPRRTRMTMQQIYDACAGRP